MACPFSAIRSAARRQGSLRGSLARRAFWSDIEPSQLSVQLTSSPRPKPTELSDHVFGKLFTDHMLVIHHHCSKGWSAPLITPYASLALDPSASVLHYATTCFEGMKAYRTAPDAPVRLFRPALNAARLRRSAQRLAFPAFDEGNLVECIKKLVKLDSHWIPTRPGYSLYIRPTIFGSAPGLGVGKPSEITLLVICSPVGPYYSKGFHPISLLASTAYRRAWPGGSGSFKLGANYPTGVLAQTEAQQEGYDQVLWLFGDEDQVTEVGTMNLFVALQDDNGEVELVTPPLDDMILPGITRRSTIELLEAHINGSLHLEGLPTKMRISERPIPMSEIVLRAAKHQLKEVFGTGTAAIVAPVERIGYKGQDIMVPVGPTGLGQFADVIQREILGRQMGEIPSDWSEIVN